MFTTQAQAHQGTQVPPSYGLVHARAVYTHRVRVHAHSEHQETRVQRLEMTEVDCQGTSVPRQGSWVEGKNMRVYTKVHIPIDVVLVELDS